MDAARDPGADRTLKQCLLMLEARRPRGVIRNDSDRLVSRLCAHHEMGVRDSVQATFSSLGCWPRYWSQPAERHAGEPRRPSVSLEGGSERARVRYWRSLASGHCLQLVEHLRDES